MGKIGRNEPCVCGSGIKYKKCCLVKELEERYAAMDKAKGEASEHRQVIHEAVEQIKNAAKEKKQLIGPLGVLVLFSTVEGDSWLLEVTEGDALQLTDQGNDIKVEIDENPDTTEIEWSHTFSFKDERVVVVSYKEKTEKTYEAYPVNDLVMVIDKIRETMPAGVADMVHASRGE